MFPTFLNSLKQSKNLFFDTSQKFMKRQLAYGCNNTLLKKSKIKIKNFN
jgi:hypothetical protein